MKTTASSVHRHKRERKERAERLRRHKIEIQKLEAELLLPDAVQSREEVTRINARLRTLRQMIRYIGDDS
jgi:hypothetical protein